VSERDLAAHIARRDPRGFFGYQAHLVVGQDSDLIRKAIFTRADIGESISGGTLICGDEQAMLADKSRESMTRRATLAEIGIIGRSMHRPPPSASPPLPALAGLRGQTLEALWHDEAALSVPALPFSWPRPQPLPCPGCSGSS
jgi:IS5 family transposase